MVETGMRNVPAQLRLSSEQPQARHAQERVAFDWNRDAVAINGVNPLDLNKIDQIHVVVGSRFSDSDRPRSGLCRRDV